MKVPCTYIISYLLQKSKYLVSRNVYRTCNYMQRRTEWTVGKSHKLMSFREKIALITGGTSGIGLATASELLHNNVSHVFISGIDKEEGQQAIKQLCSTYGSNRCSYLHLNVISEEQLKEAFLFIERHFGGVDILFNNAGILDDKRWELAVETNLKATIQTNLIGLKHMSKSNNCSSSQSIIINNADICALDPLPTVPVYTATKFGVLGVTRCLGSHYHFNKTGVRVVCLCCGPTDTTLVKKSAHKQLNEEWGQETYDTLTKDPLLKPSVVGRGVIYLIKYAPSNSVWTIENDTLYLSKIPEKEAYNVYISHL